MAVVCSELQEDYFLSNIATSIFTDMEGEADSGDSSCKDKTGFIFNCLYSFIEDTETAFDISENVDIDRALSGPLAITLGSRRGQCRSN